MLDTLQGLLGIGTVALGLRDKDLGYAMLVDIALPYLLDLFKRYNYLWSVRVQSESKLILIHEETMLIHHEVACN